MDRATSNDDDNDHRPIHIVNTFHQQKCFMFVIICNLYLSDRASCRSGPLAWPCSYYLIIYLLSQRVNLIYTVSQKKNCATFIFTVTLANVGRFLKFFQCRNQKDMAHNKNEKFPTVA